MAHELRTPLTLIVGPVADILAKAELQAPVRATMSRIAQNAERLLHLTDTMLEYHRHETLHQPLRLLPTDLKALAGEKCLHYRELLTNSRVGIVFDAQPDTAFTLPLDADAVATIIDNLMGNALKFTTRGEIRLSLRREATPGGDRIRMAVSDTGRGIPEAELPYIFDLYYKGQPADDTDIMGTGIGLSLVASLVKAHGATIAVESREGHGTTFTISFGSEPAAAPQPDGGDNPDHSPAEQTCGRKSAAPMVLIVEDNAEIRSYIASTLSQKYRVAEAQDGVEGMARAAALMPDLIVTDLMMPRLDGMAMATRLKKDVATSHIPLIILTAKATTATRTEAYRIGAESFMPKPFTAKLLLSRVANILQSQRQTGRQVQSAVAGTDKARLLESSLSSLDREFIAAVERVIRDNMANEDLDVNLIASELNMSYSTMYRKVRAITGGTVNALVRRIRIRKAEQLMLTGRYSISEISMRVGLTSPSNFRAIFREEFGTTPTEYLRELKTPNDK